MDRAAARFGSQPRPGITSFSDRRTTISSLQWGSKSWERVLSRRREVEVEEGCRRICAATQTDVGGSLLRKRKLEDR